MIIEVVTKAPLTTIYRANCVSIGKLPREHRAFSDEWTMQQVRAAHSTLEFVHIEIYDESMRGDVASHLVRHTQHAPRWVVQSKRPDWNKGQPRPTPSSPRMFLMQSNPKALLAMARVRLCNLAMEETRWWMDEVVDIMKTTQGNTEDSMLLRCLGKMMVTECEYRGCKCPYGDRSCGKYEILK